MPRTQRGGCDINRGTGVTQSRSSIYLILIWLSTTSCPPPCRTGKKGGDDSDPPRNGGLLRSRIAARCPTPLSGPMRGRYRPYLSLREGSEKDHNGGARREGGRHWCSIPFPSWRMISDWSSPSRVRFAVSRSGSLRAERFLSAMLGQSHPQGRSGLTCPGAEAIRGFGFWFSRSWFIHSSRRSYYLFLLLVLTTCKVIPNSRRIEPGVIPNSRRIEPGVIPNSRGKLPRITQPCGKR